MYVPLRYGWMVQKQYDVEITQALKWDQHELKIPACLYTLDLFRASILLSVLWS